MKVLIACDKFKGSLTAQEACDAIRKGFVEGNPSASLEIRTLPISDGGEGLAQTLTNAHNGTWKTTEVLNAQGCPTLAGYGISGDGKVGYLEMAEASGLAELAGLPLDPWTASTYGTGQLIREAASHGIDHLILGIGGSATNDGGTGMASALGFQFLDDSGDPVGDLPVGLENAVYIEEPDHDSIPQITVACDVRNPLLGPRGATRVYGPQKGIAEKDFIRHEERFSHLCTLLGERGRRAAEEPGTGAAGGLGFGCRIFLNAELKRGFDLVATSLNLTSHIDWADLVITGEGKIDTQSLEGKAPYGVAVMARNAMKPVAAFCGICEQTSSSSKDLEDHFGKIYEIAKDELSLEKNLAKGASHLSEAAARFIRSL